MNTGAILNRINFGMLVAAGRLPHGFDDAFVDLWRFYLMYCEGGFYGGVSSIAVQSDGKILIGGAFNTVNNVTVNRLARLERRDQGIRDRAQRGSQSSSWKLATRQAPPSSRIVTSVRRASFSPPSGWPSRRGEVAASTATRPSSTGPTSAP